MLLSLEGLYSPVRGTLVSTEASDTASFNALAGALASLAATEAIDTTSMAVNATWAIALAATEAQDTASIAAAIVATATLSATEASDTASFTVIRSYTFAADFGTYTYSGYPVMLSTGHGIGADQGTLAVTGFNAGLIHSYPFMAEQGNYSETGYAVRMFESSFFYEDNEIIRVPSTVNYIMVAGENRTITLQKDYTVEELLEDRVVEAEARLRA